MRIERTLKIPCGAGCTALYNGFGVPGPIVGLLVKLKLAASVALVPVVKAPFVISTAPGVGVDVVAGPNKLEIPCPAYVLLS